jgi:hypothetical protein
MVQRKDEIFIETGEAAKLAGTAFNREDPIGAVSPDVSF